MGIKINPFTGQLDLTGGVGPTTVTGPGSATDNAIVRWDGTSGTLVQNSTATVSDSGVLNLPNLSIDTVLIGNGSKDVVSSSVTSSSLTYLLNNEGLTTFNMADNQVSAADVATWPHASFTSIHLEYSIARGAGNRENGDLFLITDGTSISISQDYNNIGTSGVSFSADISGANVRLRYTSTSTGTAPSMKYKVSKWLA